jgi:hypothetical protein
MIERRKRAFVRIPFDEAGISGKAVGLPHIVIPLDAAHSKDAVVRRRRQIRIVRIKEIEEGKERPSGGRAIQPVQ